MPSLCVQEFQPWYRPNNKNVLNTHVHLAAKPYALLTDTIANYGRQLECFSLGIKLKHSFIEFSYVAINFSLIIHSHSL